jgi:hypothetical protein
MKKLLIIEKNELATVVAFLILAAGATIAITTNGTTILAYGQGGGAPTIDFESAIKNAGNLTDLVITDKLYNTTNANATEVQTLAAQDPQFKSFTEIWRNCMNDLTRDNGTISPSQCQTSFDEATSKWCGIEAYDAKKCEHATDLVSAYNITSGALAILKSRVE